MADRVDPRTRGYESWTGGLRAGAKWLGLLLAGLVSALLGRLPLPTLFRDHPHDTTIQVGVLFAMVVLLAVSGIVVESDSEADLTFELQKKPERVARTAVERRLNIVLIPLQPLRDAAQRNDARALPRAVQPLREPADDEPVEPVLALHLPHLLVLQQQLHLLQEHPEKGHHFRPWSKVLDDSIDQLRARLTYEKTKRRLLVCRLVTAGASITAAGILLALLRLAA